MKNSKGYHISVDPSRNLVKLRLHGFWDADLATKFMHECSRTIKDFSQTRTTWYVLADVVEFLPQAKDVQTILKAMMNLMKQHGITKIARIVNTSLTKLQLTRLSQETGLSAVSYFATEQEAIQWLLQP